jgi:hypothetical protein
MILLIFWIGLFPNHLLRKMDASVTHLLAQIGGGSQAELSWPVLISDRRAGAQEGVDH